MDKKNIKKLALLVMEQLNPGQDNCGGFYFVNNLSEVPDKNTPEQEVSEMARASNDVVRQLDTPVRIPVDKLTKKSRNPKPLPKIASKDPESGEVVENMVIATKKLIKPSGLEILQFENYGEPRSERVPYTIRFIVAETREYCEANPRNADAGTSWTGSKISNIPDDETQDQEGERYQKEYVQGEANAKNNCYFKGVNKLFERVDVINKLDSSLIPEPWASSKTTEQRTNVEQHFSFGANTPKVMVEFRTVRDSDNAEEAIDSILNTRLAIEDRMEDEHNNNENETTRKKPDYVRRGFAGHIYTKGGEWYSHQRIGGEEKFKEEGEYTPIYHLFKKSIQAGQRGLNVETRLKIYGDLEGVFQGAVKGATTRHIDTTNDRYRMVIIMESFINFRSASGQVGQKIGNIYEPIRVSISALIPEGTDPKDLTFTKNPDFFYNKNGDGVFQRVLDELGKQILDQINPDEVLNKILELLENEAANQVVAEGKKRKMKITEAQLARVLNVIEEQKFDDAITKFQQNKGNELTMSYDDVTMLVSLAQNWCKGKEHPQCDEVESLRSKLNLY